MTKVLDAPVKTETPSFPLLNAFDRCDGGSFKSVDAKGSKIKVGCGAQGIVRAVNPKVAIDGKEKVADLVFCKHHGERYEPGLIAAGFTLHDESERIINLKPTDPSRHKV